MSEGAVAGLSSTRKVAILMVLLGPEVAGPLLRNLSRDTVGRIAAEVKGLAEIPPDLARSVLEEYFVEAVRPAPDRGGAQLARELLNSADLSEQVQVELLGADALDEPTTDLLGPLLRTPPGTLAGILGEEHPQTSALVLLNLEPTQAAQVLGHLSEEQRSETLQRMCNLRQVRGDILGEVVDSLRERLEDPATVDEAPQADGMERTAEVLQAMSRAEVRELLDDVEKADAERAQQLRQLVNTFEMLEVADDRGIQELLRMVETRSLALALKDEPATLVDKFLGNLSERAAGMLREEIEFLGTIRPADKKTAQDEIIHAALQLEQDEKLIFQEPTEETP